MKIKYLYFLCFPIIASCVSGSNIDSSQLTYYETPVISSINQNTLSLGKKSNGVFNNLNASNSELIETKTIQNNLKRSQQENRVQFSDAEGNLVEPKPFLIDYLVFQNISYYAYSSLPLTNERFMESQFGSLQTKNILIKNLAKDFIDDVDDIYSYYLINHVDGSVIDLKQSIRTFNEYFQQLKGFEKGEFETSSSGSGSSGGQILDRYCGLLSIKTIFNFGFLGETACHQKGNAFGEMTDLVLFTFDSNSNEFEYSLHPLQNKFFTFITPSGIGLGVDNNSNQFKYDFVQQKYLPVGNLISYFNPLIYTWNGIAQPSWFEQVFVQSPLYFDENSIFYSDYDRIVEFDLQLNFLKYITTDSVHNHAYETLQHQMDGFGSYYLGTMGQYEVKLVGQYDREKNISKSFIMLFNRNNLMITVSNHTPVVLNPYIVIGDTLVGYSSVTDVDKIELFQWQFTDNTFKSLYDFNLNSEDQLQGDFFNLMPSTFIEQASTGYSKVLLSNSTNTKLNYKVISLLTGELFNLEEEKPVQVFSNQVSIIK